MQKSTAENKVDRNSFTFEEGITLPKITKYNDRIQTFQNNLAKQLISKNYSVELMRNQEVIIISIPSEDLFIASDTILSAKSSSVLSPLIRLLNLNNLYNVVVAYHTDNNGSARYKQNITQARVDAVYDWMTKHVDNTSHIVPYAMSDLVPVADNTSVSNRKINRRLEIYLVPAEGMIELAKKNNLKEIIVFDK